MVLSFFSSVFQQKCKSIFIEILGTSEHELSVSHLFFTKENIIKRLWLIERFVIIDVGNEYRRTASC